MKKTINNKILSSYTMPSDIEDMMIEHHALIDEFSKEIFPKINSKGYHLFDANGNSSVSSEEKDEMIIQLKENSQKYLIYLELIGMILIVPIHLID